MSSSAPNSNGTSHGSAHTINSIDRYLSVDGRARQSGSLSNLIFKFATVPDVVGFHGGLPRQEAFPFSGITFTLKDGQEVNLNPEQVIAAQQYNLKDSGYPPLQQWAADAVEKLHSPPGPHSVAITSGSNHALDMVLGLLLNRGDWVLTEEDTYPHMVDSITGPHGYKLRGVPYDRHGIIPSEMEKSLSKAVAEGQPLPKVLYTVPIGQNPVSFCIPAERRHQIYEICQRHDLLILEDDPYWAMQYPAESNGELGVHRLGKSFLSMDTDGRVVRLDSFAKMLAPGMRVGWLTAHPELTARFCFAHHGSCLGANSVMQVVLHQMLTQWGWPGLDQHCKRIQAFYRNLADTFHETALQELAGLAEWHRPEGGMFVWLKFLGGIWDYDDLLDLMLEEKVSPAPGSICSVHGPRPDVGCPWARICFASANQEQLCSQQIEPSRHLGSGHGAVASAEPEFVQDVQIL
ncbi:hypothetical protein WJX74_007852 [Apatococcus lobatus]|uniref:Aminotransferase class I/classII large domain-containing protein n=1 Tax=Apatococcus lobatus TaxID=904363 RepID=A0AAW1RVT1_9CHLO